MNCSHCKQEISDGVKFCPNCGAKVDKIDSSPLGQAPAAETTVQQPKPSHVKTILIVILIAIGVVASVFGIQAYSKASKYNSAIEKYEAGNYEEAEALFAQLSDYKDSVTYQTECAYQKAIQYIEKDKFDDAISILTDLADYSQAVKYLEEAFLGRKYAHFNESIHLSSDAYGEIGIKSSEEAESLLNAHSYGSWFEFDTNEPLNIDYKTINSREYVVNSATFLNDTLCVYFNYLDEPQTEYKLTKDFEYFNYIEEYVYRMILVSVDDNPDTYHCYYSVTTDEYNDLMGRNAEILASQPNYSDQEIIDRTFTMFRDRIAGNYSGAGTLYHNAEYSGANVIYDSSTRTYFCTMTGQYSTNVFDFWGTSTQTYFVSAEFLDNGYDLSMIGFNIS